MLRLVNGVASTMKDQQYVYVETASRPKQEDCARSPLDFVIHQKEDAKKNYPGDAAQVCTDNIQRTLPGCEKVRYEPT